MRDECIEAVGKAIGRKISKVEAQNIEQRILGNMSDLARRDPQAWQGKTQAERLTEAADRAAQQLIGEAQAAKVRTAQNLQAQAKLQSVAAKGAGAVFDELERVDSYRKGIERDYWRQALDAFDAVHGKLLGLVEDAKMAKALIDEIHGRDSGSAVAKKAAQAWLQVAEAMRLRANRMGADIGKLDYAYLPQSHDAAKLIRAGQDKWVADTLPLLDRSRYTNPDGKAATDAQLTDMLKAAWTTISTGGANKIEPGQHRAAGGLAGTPSSKAREIHFKGPDEFAAYQQVYGAKSLLGSMQAHVGRMARDIALAENLGPNWNGNFQFARDTLRQAGQSTRAMGGLFDIESAFKTMTGAYNQPAHARLADISQGLRNIQVAAKLGGAVLSSFTDAATLIVTSGFNRLPMHQLLANMIRSFGKDAKEFGNRSGLIADSIISDANRWAEGNIGAGWTSKAANLTMKASFMNAWTDWLRRAFSITMMAGLGKLSRVDWGKLDAADRTRLERAGFTEADWKVANAAKLEDWRDQKMLTPESLGDGADQLRAKLLGYITDESEYAVVNPDLATRTIAQGSTQKGTAAGELWRSVMLFKSFPIAMITRHWDRALNDETMTGAGRLAYGSALLVGLTALGYASMSAKDIAKGRDPRDVDDPKTWGAAFVQGGGFGLVGDFLFHDQNRFGNSITETLAGPVASTFADLVKLTVGNVQEAAQGKDTHAGAELVKFMAANTPGASLWYARGAIDRAFLHSMQEALSPGYIARVKAAGEKQGSRYWFEPGKLEPARAPDLSRMIPNLESTR